MALSGEALSEKYQTFLIERNFLKKPIENNEFKLHCAIFQIMNHNEIFITLSEAIYRLAIAKGEWPNTLEAKKDVINAALEGKITIYGHQRYLKECEAVPAYALVKPLTLPLLDLHSLVKTPNPTNWKILKGKNDDRIGDQWRRLCIFENQLLSILTHPQD